MMTNKQNIITKLSQLKKKYQKEGFLIIGLFGSYAREENKENSDIDIVYEIDDTYLKKYPGFQAISRVIEIGKELSEEFKTHVDLVSLPKYGNKRIQEKIKKDLINV